MFVEPLSFIVVPLRPGPQSISVEWRLPDNPGGWTRVDAVNPGLRADFNPDAFSAAFAGYLQLLHGWNCTVMLW